MPAPQPVRLTPEDTLATAFAARVALTPGAPAYREFNAEAKAWRSVSWSGMASLVARVRAAFEAEGLAPGDRVAVMLRNSTHWVAFDQGAFAAGLVTVPLYVDDRPENLAYCVEDSGARVLVVEGEEHLRQLARVKDRMPALARIVTVKRADGAGDPRVTAWDDWLPADAPARSPAKTDPKALATIVYTSGTTGRPKGVMLSHANMLANVAACLEAFEVYPQDVFLSFLPLSHMFERTVGCYLTMTSGSEVAFARSIPQLAEDFRQVRPSIIVSVPRIFERLHATIRSQLRNAKPAKRALFDFAHRTGWRLFQWRQGRGAWHPSFLAWPLLRKLVASKLLERLGGRLRLAISGGAALNPVIARTFIGLGLPLCQGYGLTEASPVVSVNRLGRNDPATVGEVLAGLEIAFGEHEALLVKGPSVMMGYWNQPEATAKVLSPDGWLDTGDQAKREDGMLRLTGRLKEIVVLANGEKVPPVDMELAILLDPAIQQVLVVGEARPYLAALVVPDPEAWQSLAEAEGLPVDPCGAGREKAERFLAARIAERIREFPGYAQVRRVAVIPEPWSVDNGLLTATLKPRRSVILERYADRLADLYKGHEAA